MTTDLKEKTVRAIVAAVQLPHVSDTELDVSINELRELAKTLGFEVVGSFVQKRPHFDTAAYVGVGKRQEMRHFVETGTLLQEEPDAQPVLGSAPKAARSGAARAKEAAQSAADPDTRHVDVVLVDHEISPSQARNLEIEVGCEVMDRTMVILEIFHRHAHSRAARAQVEIARLGYMAPRLREAAKLAGPKGRQRSGVGGRGAGEAHSELDRQKIRNRIAELQEEIVAMDAERKTQRARRQERQGLARVALVGYTNAGKSTLFNTVTRGAVYAADQLFATLDPTVRRLDGLESGPAVLADTVGFIRELPHDLVAAFRATLSEARDADLLLHVTDAADTERDVLINVVNGVLDEIGADGVPQLMVFNKIDLLNAGTPVGEDQQSGMHDPTFREAGPRIDRDAGGAPVAVWLSAASGAGLDLLRQAISERLAGTRVHAELRLPPRAGRLRARLIELGAVKSERYDEGGWCLDIDAPRDLLLPLAGDVHGDEAQLFRTWLDAA